MRLRYWDWKLKRRADELQLPARVAEATPPPFVEVSAATPAERGQIEIVTPRGYILRVQPDAEQQFLKRVLEAVR